MSADRSRRRGTHKSAQGESDNTTIDHHAEEAFRNLVRVLARDAARELFAKSSVAADNRDAEGQT